MDSLRNNCQCCAIKNTCTKNVFLHLIYLNGNYSRSLIEADQFS